MNKIVQSSRKRQNVNLAEINIKKAYAIRPYRASGSHVCNHNYQFSILNSQLESILNWNQFSIGINYPLPPFPDCFGLKSHGLKPWV